MSYIKTWNSRQIKNQLSSAASLCRDSRLDGFTTWPIKQELYEIKWLLDDLIDRCPRYADEPEWLNEQEKQRVFKILKT